MTGGASVTSGSGSDRRRPPAVAFALVWALVWSLVSALVGLGLAACRGRDAGPAPQPAGPTATVAARPADREALAVLAAAAKDRRYVATYTLTDAASGHRQRSVTVALAADGSWAVAIPAGALSGLADIALLNSAAGLFQCVLGPAAGTSGQRPDLGPIVPGCARMSRLTAATDPRVQHIFTDWIDALLDRASALSVAVAPPLAGAPAGGTCFSVESSSVSLAPPVDPGSYCYRSDGTLTAARVGFGTLVLTGPVGAAPSTVALPAPVVTRAPLPVTAPPPPPSPSP